MNLVKVSTMSGKLAGLQAINTDPLSNAFCLESKFAICDFCYSKYALRTYRANCRPGWANNGVILSTTRDFHLEPITNTYCRFNAHGELINSLHFDNLCTIAERFPDTHFALWTKRPELTRPERPPNLRLIFSSSEIDKEGEAPPWFDVVFSVFTKGPFSCTGKCIDCLFCYTKRGKIRVKLDQTRRQKN